MALLRTAEVEDDWRVVNENSVGTDEVDCFGDGGYVSAVDWRGGGYVFGVDDGNASAVL